MHDSFVQALKTSVGIHSSRINLLLRTLTLLHKLVRATALRLLPRTLVNPRSFSNDMLRRFGKHFKGEVINVSGWDDSDKEGGTYKEYFPLQTTYAVSNAATLAKGFGSMEGSDINEFLLDLDFPVEKKLRRRFDVVFNHTTLEHVVNFEQAFANLCAMSRETVIIVVPTLQQVHFAEGFGDYWRPTPILIAKLFYRYGFTPRVITTNDQAFGAVYIFAIGIRNPQAYPEIETLAQLDAGAQIFGSPLPYDKLPDLFQDERNSK